jgi:hypothetical protein
MAISVDLLAHLVAKVTDLEISARWYQRVPGAKTKNIARCPARRPRSVSLPAA